jgi:hypothetical protein
VTTPRSALTADDRALLAPSAPAPVASTATEAAPTLLPAPRAPEPESTTIGTTTNPWNVQRRKGPHIIPGTAIGFSYTDKDKSLVPGMLKSFSFVEFVVSYYDDNQDANFQFNESERHKAIIRKARKAGAKYFWGVGPKRRLGANTEAQIRANLHWLDEGYTLVTNYRFLWGRSLRRVRLDGFWGQRRTSAFFPISKSNVYGRRPLHHRWAPRNRPAMYIDTNQYYIGRHTRQALTAKFNFYKGMEYKDGWWRDCTLEDVVPEVVDAQPLTEKVIGVSFREWLFKG